MKLPKKLQNKLHQREVNNSLRHLRNPSALVDFSSNDYLGFAVSKEIFKKTHQYLLDNNISSNGSGGSRLLTGNHPIHEKLEALLCEYYNSESALIFNSGYDANIGLISSVPQRGDLIFYDELSHASIRDGIKMSQAKAYKFDHNDLEHLEALIKRNPKFETVYVVTESVFSMDGDSPELNRLIHLCNSYNIRLILDEAHATGVMGEKGLGMAVGLGLEHQIFARLVTFGKAIGVHGSCILCREDLRAYLINFARSFIYTTALPPHTMAAILVAHTELQSTGAISGLQENIAYFKARLKSLELENLFVESNSAIQSAIIPGNTQVKNISAILKDEGFDVRPILSPTVPEGSERLRFCLHAFNSEEEIDAVLNLLVNFVSS